MKAHPPTGTRRRHPAPKGGKRVLRILTAAGGTFSVGLGVAGAFLPVLPTTPFLLLAAWCYARSSPRLHQKLLQNRYFGPYIRKFQEEKALPPRVKILSCSLVWASLLGCTFFVPGVPLWVRPAFPVLALLITRHILSFATLRRK